MRKFCRAALLCLFSLLVPPLMTPVATNAAADGRQASNGKEKKKSKRPKGRKTKKILKGRHSKHGTKPA